jgi:predicted PhzF superfamily epimerase YddE/YHI9
MFQVDAFADALFKGNPAAVLVLDRPVPDTLMRAIAQENNLAETAFVTRAGTDWHIRWFTPQHEAAFCGHATLATAHVLCTEYGVDLPIRFTTGAVGALQVSRAKDGMYVLDLPRLEPMPLTPPPPPLAELFPDGWVEAFRNFENLFVTLPTAAAVRSYAPDLRAITQFHPLGLAITAAGGETHEGSPVDFTSRYFDPGAGIDEDPVTGSIHATLVPYWGGRLGKGDLLAFQASARGGTLVCTLLSDRVLLTGRAVTFMRAEVLLDDMANARQPPPEA